jgi:hypothetical protein
VRMSDITETAHAIHRLLDGGEVERARSLLPQERVYPIRADSAPAGIG